MSACRGRYSPPMSQTDPSSSSWKGMECTARFGLEYAGKPGNLSYQISGRHRMVIRKAFSLLPSLRRLSERSVHIHFHNAL